MTLDRQARVERTSRLPRTPRRRFAPLAVEARMSHRWAMGLFPGTRAVPRSGTVGRGIVTFTGSPDARQASRATS